VVETVLCRRCYFRRWRQWQARHPCTVDGCERGQFTAGLCGPHYKRRWRASSPNSDRPNDRRNSSSTTSAVASANDDVQQFEHDDVQRFEHDDNEPITPDEGRRS
jgi:hypothetical protein